MERKYLGDQMIKNIAQSFMLFSDKDSISKEKTIGYLKYIEISEQAEIYFSQLLIDLSKIVQSDIVHQIKDVELACTSARKLDIKRAMMTRSFWNISINDFEFLFPKNKYIKSIKYYCEILNNDLKIDELISLLVKWIYRIEYFTIPDIGAFKINYGYSLKTNSFGNFEDFGEYNYETGKFENFDYEEGYVDQGNDILDDMELDAEQKETEENYQRWDDESIEGLIMDDDLNQSVGKIDWDKTVSSNTGYPKYPV